MSGSAPIQDGWLNDPAATQIRCPHFGLTMLRLLPVTSLQQISPSVSIFKNRTYSSHPRVKISSPQYQYQKTPQSPYTQMQDDISWCLPFLHILCGFFRPTVVFLSKNTNNFQTMNKSLLSVATMFWGRLAFQVLYNQKYFWYWVDWHSWNPDRSTYVNHSYIGSSSGNR